MLAALSNAAFGAPSDLSVGDVRVVEGDSGSRSVEINVSLSAASPGPVTVTYGTKDNTALAPSDYRAATGTVTFAPGEVAKKITVAVVGDTSVELHETFDLQLTNASGATLADPTGAVTIVNDDAVGRGQPAYEVRFTFVGATGSMAGADGCPVRNNGRVVLTGLLSGNENVSRDDDIEYRGMLQLEADVDLCEIRPGLREDMVTLCALTVVGGGPRLVGSATMAT